MLEPKVFWDHMYCIEESTCDIVGTFRCPPMIRRPGHKAPLPPRYDPGMGAIVYYSLNRSFSVV